YLSMVKSAANHSKSEITQYSIFYGKYQYHPKMIFDHSSEHNTKDIRQGIVEQVMKRLKEMFDNLQSEMKRDETIELEQANKN
ncbi:hypothetical protein K440DRAFT_537435, partial [Wilcoxina mikolae CBS 423.85]